MKPKSNWHKIQDSGGLTHEQNFVITALWRDVHGMQPLTNVNAEFKRNNPERYKELKAFWRAQRRKEKR